MRFRKNLDVKTPWLKCILTDALILLVALVLSLALREVGLVKETAVPRLMGGVVLYLVIVDAAWLLRRGR